VGKIRPDPIANVPDQPEQISAVNRPPAESVGDVKPVRMKPTAADSNHRTAATSIREIRVGPLLGA
jgi:hypothetical protein